MLKALFESSIDKLNIPADMKSAIKQINNICLEAEENSTDPNERYKHDFIPSGDQKAKPAGNAEPNAKKGSAKLRTEILPKLLEDYGSDDPIIDKLNDVIKLINNPKTLKDGSAKLRKEVFAQIIKDQGNDAPILNDIKDIIKIINTPDPKKEEPKAEEAKAEEAKAEEPKAEEAKADESKTEEATAEEPKAEEAKAEDQTAQSAEPEENKGTQIAKGATREPSQVRTSGPTSSEPNTATQTAEAQPAQQNAAPKAAARPRADVATVQYFLQSLLPNTNLVADGILGPKTISAIQQKEDQEVTGKMDSKTKQSFDLLLAEAKKKVIPMQQQLGVTADGLIGKQTLQAMNKANMKVANVFSKNATAPQQAPQQVASNQPKANVNVLDTPFDAAKAQKDLQNNQITKLEYNMWKEYGVSPQHQRNNPVESKQEITRLAHIMPSERRKQQEANANANTNKNPVPQNDVEKKFYNQTVKNYIGVYTQLGDDEKTAKNHAITAAQNALIKFRAGKWGKGDQQNAQPQQAAQANAQPQQAAQANAQPAQQQAQKQPAQKAGTRQNPNVQYLSGTVSTMNLPPDEKKVFDDAVTKFKESHKKMDEQMRMTFADEAGRKAVLQYRQSKGRPMNG